ncbi:MAG: helix-turn-helix domain-containing protein [Eubacteriales bacterium]|nr:helix-turn-helix domain-containing protein [Eubacteriales bacterium]
MDVRTALVQLRDELQMRQADLAAALGVNMITVNRWETGKNPPRRSVARAILALAEGRGASTACREALDAALLHPVQEPGIDNLKFTRMDQINSLVNDSSNAVFVCDAHTRELLYVNRQLGRLAGEPVERAVGKKCYEFLFHRDTVCEFCHMGRMKNELYGGEYEAPSGRCYMIRAKLTRWNGRDAHIEYITDVTDFHKTRKELARSRELMAMACQGAEMWVFTLDVQSGEARLEPVVQQELGLPAVVPGFFARLLAEGAVLPEYAEEVARVLPRLQGGEASLELVARTRFHSTRTHWVRLRAKTVERDALGKPLTAVCSAQMIDNEMANEARIRFEHEQILSSRPDLMAFVISNVTRDLVVEHRGLPAGGPVIAPGTPYGAAVGRALPRIVPREDRERFAALHDRGALLARFAEGELGQEMEYQMRQPDGTLLWMRTELKLMLHPESGDVYLYEYGFAAHARRVMDGLLAGALQGPCELFGAISLDNGQLTRLSFGQGGAEVALKAYGRALRDYGERRVPPEDREEFWRNGSLEAVRRELSQKGAYRFAYRVQSPPGRRVAQFGWQDERRQFCLLAVVNMEWITPAQGDAAGAEEKQ